MLKKTLLAGCTLLALAWATPAAADAILFDPDGSGAGAPIVIGAFDMAPGNSIAIGANATSTPEDGAFTVYYQANLAEAGSFDNGDGGNYFTVVASFGEVVTSNTLNNAGTPLDPSDDFVQMSFDFAAGGDNFFQIYVNDEPGDNLDGVCFVCGTLIMEGHITGYNSPSSFNAFINQAPQDLDQFDDLTPDPTDDDNYPLINTLEGSGSFNIRIVIDDYDTDYFPENLENFVIGFADADGTTTIPFDSVNPSRCFLATAGGYPDGPCTDGFDGATSASIGPVNGLGENTMFETDANLTFQLVPEVVPEPASLALLGLGLLGVAGAARRRRQQAKAQAKL